MSINIYRRLAELEAAVKTVFSDSYEAEVRQPNLLLVLVFDFICQNNKLKIGGKLSRMVKDNETQLRQLLKEEKGTTDNRHLPKYAYLRWNQKFVAEANSSDSDDDEPIEKHRKQLKAEGFKVCRVQNTNILRVKNKEQPTPISQHALVKSSRFILQDLSSCMPLELLKIAIKQDLEFKRFRNKNTHLLISGVDATSSPGNKTLQLAEICQRVFAFERDPKRFKTLAARVSKAHGDQDIVRCLNLDFIEQPLPPKQESEILKFIVCDPSCSGSGMSLHAVHGEDSQCCMQVATPSD